MSAIEIDGVLTGHNGIKTRSDGSVYEGWIIGKANSVGGIGCSHRIFNATEKTIKYVTFTYLPYNQVKDVVKCQTNGRSEASGKLTGPIEPKEECAVQWDALWYNPTISKVAIKEVHVEYMDGTDEIIPGDQILTFFSPDSVHHKLKEEKKAAEEARKQQEKEEAMQAINALKDSVVGGLKGLFKKK